MTKQVIIVLSALLLAGAAVSWKIQHRADTMLRKTSAALLEQSEQLARLREEAAHLSNTLDQVTSPQPLSDAQFHNLLRLRSEVGRLSSQRAEIAQLQATNQQIRTTLVRSQQSQSSETHWAREQLSYAGYADPESAIVTTLWAFNQNDPNVQLSLLTPEDRAFFDTLAIQGKPVDVAAYCRNIGELLNPSTATEIHLVGKKFNSPDEALLDLYYEGEGKTRRFLMRQVGGNWRFIDLVSLIAN